MNPRPAARPLSERERAILSVVLADPRTPDSILLQRQLGAARVTSGLPTFVDIEVTDSTDRADSPDGPLPIRTIVTDECGATVGEILVWVSQGYLSGLEYAWYTDEAPTELPAPERIRPGPE